MAEESKSESTAAEKKTPRTKRPAASGKTALKSDIALTPPKRGRVVRNFPASPFEEALGFAQSILEYGAGASVRRVTLFNHLGKSPESSLSRQIITNANKYGLIKGGYQADILELTQEGKKAADEQIQLRERTRSRIQLAILDIPPFSGLYSKYQ